MGHRTTTLFYILTTMIIKSEDFHMKNYCAFSKNHKSLNLYARINVLEPLSRDAGIDIPVESIE